MLKRLGLKSNVAKYMGVLSLLVANVALSNYCYGIIGEPELPKRVKEKA